MKAVAPVVLMVVAAVAAVAQPSPRLVTLFDFESGVAGWLGNPWGGGQCAPAASAEAKFGQGALRATYTEIKQGGNVISPYFAAEAPWRGGDYDRISLWLKGDGSQEYLNLIVESGDRDKPQTYTARLPLDSKQWRRFALKFDTFWNRYDVPFELKTMQRLYFGVTGTHEALIDQIALQRPVREVPLEPLDNGGPAALTPKLYADHDNYHYLTFDPHQVLEPTVTAEITITWPQKPATRLLNTFAAQAATAEVWIPLPGMPDAVGEARLSLKLREQPGNLCYAGDFKFTTALPGNERPPSALQLVPNPKDLVYHPGKFVIPGRLRARVLSRPEVAMVAVQWLQEEMEKWLGREVTYRPEKLYPNDLAFLVLTRDEGDMPLPSEVQEKLGLLREQGYVLHVGGDRIVLAAKDAAGMRNGAITLLQALRTASPSAEEAQLPQMTIADWPTCQWRAISIGLPTTRWGHPNDAPVPVDYFIEYLRKLVVEQKLNLVVLEVLQGMKYERHPELAGPAAYTKDEVRRIVRFLRDRGVEVVPQVESLGHANWLVIPHRELREDDDDHTLCTRNPQTRRILVDCYTECLEVFEPRYFHFGLDEIRWATDRVAAEKRCPRCKGVDKREIFVEQVKWLHDWAATSGLKMMMWADMILPEHNGGAPFNLADTVDKLPRDIILCDWSATLAPLSLGDLQHRGFPVLKSNSAGVNAAQVSSVVGNMWGVWAKTPWLTESAWNIHGYCYLPNVVGAEYSWNAYPDLLAAGVPVKPEFFAKRPLAQKRLAMQPEIMSGKGVVAITPGAAQVEVAGLKLQPFTEAVTEGSVPVGRKAAALYCLLAADLPEPERAKFLDGFKQAANWQGIPIGALEFVYADGTSEQLPLRYGMQVRATAVAEPFPQALGALGTAPVGQRMAYLVQWVNPHPERPVASVKLTPGSMAAKPLLLGLAAREVWEGR